MPLNCYHFTSNTTVDLLNFDFLIQNPWLNSHGQADRCGFCSIRVDDLPARLLRVYPNSAMSRRPCTNVGSIQLIRSSPCLKKRLLQLHPTYVPGDVQAARTAYQKAATVKGQVTRLWANIHSAVASEHTRELRVLNIRRRRHRVLHSASTYKDLFGTLDYCECEHCKSILDQPHISST